VIYLHVPFCGSFCTYCDFYSEVCRKESVFNEYADAVIAEVDSRREEILMNISAPSAVRSFYIGGGTPSVLPLSVLRRVVGAVTALTGGAGNGLDGGFKGGQPVGRSGGLFDEFTVEVNPEDIVEKGDEYVGGLLALGVDRVSMGVQSFDDGILRWMNRRHDSERAVEAFRILRRCGVRNISLDLIFGISQLTDEVWRNTVEKAVALAPEHISAYQLSIEEGSALAGMVADGRYVEASDEQCRRQYDILCGILARAGYHHYEISNFARPGFEAVHNSAYWRRVPYVGLGPGAHSFSGDVRSWNSQTLPHRRPSGGKAGDPAASPADDLAGNPSGDLVTYSRNPETLTPEDIRVERIMLSLRTDLGLEAEELYSLTQKGVVDALLAEGSLERAGERVRIPESRFFTSDEIIRALV
jgi:oxygen-independent coproporphyrinogen III oxidase